MRSQLFPASVADTAGMIERVTLYRAPTTEALRGYVLQAVHYLATGEGFCAEPGCRLHNPHRQPGVVEAQLRDPPFCDRHADLYGTGD